jgi:hypothetical protein
LIYLTMDFHQNDISLKHSYSHNQLMGINDDVMDVVTCEGYYTNG